MRKKHNPSADALELRGRAEERLQERQGSKKREEVLPGTSEGMLRLIQELQIHQVELEMQNEELRNSRIAVEGLLDQYTNLYDLAPVGYFTLDRDGRIRRVNLTGASLLGEERLRLVNRLLGLYISEADHPAYNEFLQKVFTNGAAVSDKAACEVTLRQQRDHTTASEAQVQGVIGGPRQQVHIEAQVTEGGQECRSVMMDITERRELENGLEKTRKELEVTKISEDAAREYAESIINTIREPLIALDQNLRVVTASRSFYTFFKVKHEETVGQLIYDLGSNQWDIPKLRELLETILPEKATFDNYEVEHDFTTIGRRTMLLNARQIQRVWGKQRIILLAIEDITERKEIETGLEKTRKELAVIKIAADEVSEYAESLINTVREPLIALDQDLRVVKVSRSFYGFFKVNPEETMGKLIYDLGNRQWDIPKLRELLETILPEKATFDNYEVEHDFATIGRRTMLLNARQIKRAFGKERIILLAIEDITERKQSENKILRMVYHDLLTGLPNRKLFSDRLGIALAQAQRNKKEVGVAMLDLDNFKGVNDTLGHDVGDLLLNATAERLSAALRKGDTVARFGGDEFTLILPDLEVIEDAIQVAQKIVESFRKPFLIDTRQLVVTTSIGIAVYPTDGMDEGILLKNADIAMYHAKQAGRDRYQLWIKA